MFQFLNKKNSLKVKVKEVAGKLEEKKFKYNEKCELDKKKTKKQNQSCAICYRHQLKWGQNLPFRGKCDLSEFSTFR